MRTSDREKEAGKPAERDRRLNAKQRFAYDPGFLAK
jgi:hypothetical protein